jgi:hypothetical protein
VCEVLNEFPSSYRPQQKAGLFEHLMLTLDLARAPTDLSISLSRGEKINQDSLSNGERTEKSLI